MSPLSTQLNSRECNKRNATGIWNQWADEWTLRTDYSRAINQYLDKLRSGESHRSCAIRHRQDVIQSSNRPKAKTVWINRFFFRCNKCRQNNGMSRKAPPLLIHMKSLTLCDINRRAYNWPHYALLMQTLFRQTRAGSHDNLPSKRIDVSAFSHSKTATRSYPDEYTKRNTGIGGTMVRIGYHVCVCGGILFVELLFMYLVVVH